ncbi:xylose repressor [Gemmatimonadetes bacterium T265]|nr:xylose repressor [Gemmatimonadetes bacterium T265]
MADQTLARLVNERRVLTLLRVRGMATRADLARHLALTPSTITNLIDDLVGRGLAREVPTVVSRARRELGRPGIRLELNPDGGYFLGAEIGVGTIRTALVDLTARVVESTEEAVPTRISPDDALRVIVRQLRARTADPRYGDRIASLAITVPGLVRRDGFIVHLPILGWRNVNLLAAAAGRVPVPTLVANNANAAAFGEIYADASIEQEMVLYLKLGTGCGGAVVVQGRLLRGFVGTATEIGHTRIRQDGPRCSCGGVGCLETFVNLGALAALARPGEQLSTAALAALPAEVAAAAAAGSAVAQAAVDAVASDLAAGLVSLVNVFNPQTVILGGAMRPVLGRALPAVESAVASGIVPGMSVPTMRLSTLGSLECAVGAACMAHHQAVDVSAIEVVQPTT